MGARMVAILLLALLAAFQAQLWFGRGSIPDVAQMQRKLVAQQAANAQARLVDERLASEVSDLKQGLDMVEEQARMELGMVKPSEIFVQVKK